MAIPLIGNYFSAVALLMGNQRGARLARPLPPPVARALAAGRGHPGGGPAESGEAPGSDPMQASGAEIATGLRVGGAETQGPVARGRGVRG